MFNAPIPGQSLTKEPRNNAWERPPETADAEEAIVHHLTRLSQPEVLDNVIDAIDSGLPISTVTDLILTGAVANGIHSIDLSMAIAPVIHEHLLSVVQDSGIEFKEFFDEDTSKSTQTAALSKALENLRNTPVEEQDEGYDMMEEVLTSEQEDKPKEGLMKRRTV